jgi:hypothetical protein
MLLVSGATKTMAKLSDPRLGRLMTPGNGNRPDHLPWAVDNGAFAGFKPKAFTRMLDRFRGMPGCLWVASPDVVVNAAGTLELFREWEPRLHADGWPVALVAQDGLTAPPWDSFECLFIGGSTEYKLSGAAEQTAWEAKRRGKLVHMGRVNTVRRMRAAHQAGADSIDGGKFSRWADEYIQWGLDWIARVDAQGAIGEAAR